MDRKKPLEMTIEDISNLSHIFFCIFFRLPGSELTRRFDYYHRSIVIVVNKIVAYFYFPHFADNLNDSNARNHQKSPNGGHTRRETRLAIENTRCQRIGQGMVHGKLTEYFY